MDLLAKVRGNWAKLSSTNKSVIVVGAVCLILSTFLFVRWATKVEYAPLFTNMQADSAGKIVENLKAMNVPYDLDDAGQTVLVPADQVYELRLELASKGAMPESGYGFELFDTSNMGFSDFERNVNYQRALQEELRRTIVKIDAVQQARVHIVLPEKSAFIENEHEPQASIVLGLKPMVELQPEQIKAIAELVAGSIQNLKVEDVNIIDTAGNILSNQIKKNSNTALELDQLELRRAFEKDLELRLQQLLDSIYGHNKAVAMVTANLDFNQKQTNRTVWGREGVVASEQTTERMTTNTDNSIPVGESNRDPDLIGIPELTSSGADTVSIKNYEIDKLEEQEIYAPGRVLSISTAVAINGELPTEAEMQIRDIISAAIGFDAERGDTINVLSTEFDQSELEAAQAEMAELDAAQQEQARTEQWMAWGLKGLGIAVLLILGLAIIRTVKSRLETPEISPEQPESIHEVEEQLARAQKEVAAQFVSEDKEIKKILDDQPEVAAKIVTTWLEEDESEDK